MSSLEQYKKQKKLEEQARTGKIDPKVEKELLATMNAHIPVFVERKPWYADEVPKVKRLAPTSIDEWYTRGSTVHKATKYRKGACENCGAMSHRTKDCVERPRKRGAKWTGKEIMADELIQDVNLDFAAKRDRWNGYDASEQLELVKEWELVEEKRRQLRELKRKEKLEKKQKLQDAGIDVSSDSDDSDDEKYADTADQVGQKVDSKAQVTVRNLRIREDTAKYLRNLNPESAFYDPKSRSMRDNPYQDKAPTEVDFAGDNFLRESGQVADVNSLEVFAWDAGDRGSNIHLQTNPTMAETLYRKTIQEQKGKQQELQKEILQKYGGEEHLDILPKELLLAQSEHYVEYSQEGKVIKGQEKAIPKSKYEEDIYPMNHTSIWGSFWKDGKWGYKCCEATLKNAYCQGKPMETEVLTHEPVTERKTLLEISQEIKKTKPLQDKSRSDNEYLIEKHRKADPMLNFVDNL